MKTVIFSIMGIILLVDLPMKNSGIFHNVYRNSEFWNTSIMSGTARGTAQVIW